MHKERTWFNLKNTVRTSTLSSIASSHLLVAINGFLEDVKTKKKSLPTFFKRHTPNFMAVIKTLWEVKSRLPLPT